MYAPTSTRRRCGGPGPNYAPETFITPGGKTRGDDGGRRALSISSLFLSVSVSVSLHLCLSQQQSSRHTWDTRRNFVTPADHIFVHLGLRDHKGKCEWPIFLVERFRRIRKSTGEHNVMWHVRIFRVVYRKKNHFKNVFATKNLPFGATAVSL